MKRLMTFELEPRAFSRQCFGVLVNNICTATGYYIVRSLEKNYNILTYERVFKKKQEKKYLQQHVPLQIQSFLHFYQEIGVILRKNKRKQKEKANPWLLSTR